MKKIAMSELLEILKKCDSFSLTTTIDNISITKEDKHKIMTITKRQHKEFLLKEYNKLNENLLPFENLYQEIEKECLSFSEKYKEKYLKKHGFFENSFICDHVGQETKYKEPLSFFWRFYHTLGMELDYEVYLDDLIQKNNKLKPLAKLKDDLLKSNLINYEISFQNHCTESSVLMINYYFYLNEDTRAWLLQFKSDFDLSDEFEDLAFYQNGELKFSSCTHEKYNTILND